VAALSWFVFAVDLGRLEPSRSPTRVYPVGNFISTGRSAGWPLAVMLVVVTTVSSLVHLYSWGYMAEDPGKPVLRLPVAVHLRHAQLIARPDFMQLFFRLGRRGLAATC